MTQKPNQAAKLCPYCGHVQFGTHPCESCKGNTDPKQLKITQMQMGPWYVRDSQQPFLPGMSFDALCKKIKTGKITARSIVRGPTTQQFWSLAKFVPGIAHQLGSCHNCQKEVGPSSPRCPHCNALFPMKHARDELGLAYKTDDAAQKAKASLTNQAKPNAATSAVKPTTTAQAIATTPNTPPAATPPTTAPINPLQSTAEDLLSSILDLPPVDQGPKNGAS